MPNAFPETPVSLLACIEERRAGPPYQKAWKSFFDLYHGAIRLEVRAAFRRSNWHHVSEELLEETIADVVISFFKAEFSYDPTKGRFRNYLRQLTAWRVCDQIAKLSRKQLERSEPAEILEALETRTPETDLAEGPHTTLENNEQEAYRAVLLATMLEDVRNRVSPQTFLMFELTKLQGESPDKVASRFKVKRNVVDNASYRVLQKLKELARQPEYQREYFE